MCVWETADDELETLLLRTTECYLYIVYVEPTSITRAWNEE